MRSSLLASACAQSRAHRRLDTCAPPSPAKQTANKPNQHERMPPLFSYRSLCSARSELQHIERAVRRSAYARIQCGSGKRKHNRLCAIRPRSHQTQAHTQASARDECGRAKSCAVTAERHPRKLKAKLPTAGNVHAALHSNSFGLFRLQRQVRWQPQPTCNTICYGLDFGHSATRSETSHRAAAVLGTSPLAAAPAYRRERDRVRGVQVARRGVEWRWCGERSRPW